MIPIIIFFVVVIGLISWAVSIYNKMVTGRNKFKNAFSQIDVQLKRRHDLIPNLVETAKSYMKFEQETLTAVTAARNQAVKAADAVSTDPTDPSLMHKLLGAEGALAGAMTRFMAVVEQYPDLKANQHMSQLMEELTSTENRVAFARQAYNDAVMTYNNSLEVFPNVIFAGMFKFVQGVLYEIEDETERAAPKVSFS